MPRGPGKNCRLTTPGEINPFPIKAALVFEIAVVWLECINNGKFAQRYPASASRCPGYRGTVYYWLRLLPTLRRIQRAGSDVPAIVHDLQLGSEVSRSSVQERPLSNCCSYPSGNDPQAINPVAHLQRGGRFARLVLVCHTYYATSRYASFVPVAEEEWAWDA